MGEGGGYTQVIYVLGYPERAFAEVERGNGQTFVYTRGKIYV